MNEILERNLEELRKYYAEIYEKIKDNDSILNDTSLDLTNTSFFNKRNNNNEEILVIKKDNNNYRMNSIYNAKEEADNWAEKVSKDSVDSRVFIFGLGNGMHINSFISKHKYAKVMVFEPSADNFIFILQHYDITNILNNCILVVNDINIERFNIYSNLFLSDFGLDNVQIISLPNYKNIYLSEYVDFYRLIKDAMVGARTNENTLMYFQDVYLDNTVNWFKNHKSEVFLDELKDFIPEGLTGIIVSAGPSLEKNILQLKRAKGKAFILCVNTSLDFMSKMDIEPDAGIIIDPMVGESHFQSDMSKNVPIIRDIVAPLGVMNKINGPKISIANGGNKYQTSIMSRLEKYYPIYVCGGSVATAACAILLKLGIKRIVLIGQDLAYGEDGADHAFGRNDKEDMQTFEVDGYYGGKVKTRSDWKGFLRWFETNIPIYNDLGIEVIDATEGGALIKGSKIMTLSDVIDEYCNVEFDFKKKLESIKKDNDIELDNKLLDIAKNDLSDLKAIKNKVKKAIDSSEKLIKLCNKHKFNSNKNMKDIKRISNTNKFCEEKEVYKLIEMHDKDKIQTVLVGVNKLYDDDNKNWLVTFTKNRDMHKIIEESAEMLIPIFEDVVKTLENNITENKTDD